MKYKFKVGDWVKIIDNKSNNPELDTLIGCIGKIIQVEDLVLEYPYYVTIKDLIVTKDLARYFRIHEKEFI